MRFKRSPRSQRDNCDEDHQSGTGSEFCRNTYRWIKGVYLKKPFQLVGIVNIRLNLCKLHTLHRSDRTSRAFSRDGTWEANLGGYRPKKRPSRNSWEVAKRRQSERKTPASREKVDAERHSCHEIPTDLWGTKSNGKNSAEISGGDRPPVSVKKTDTGTRTNKSR